jgi:isoamylase
MLLGGDERGRTQHGNNNGYCQDNKISWFDWDRSDEALLAFTRRLIHFRKSHPVFRRRRWFQGRPIHDSGMADIGWFKPDGKEMSGQDWQNGFAKALGLFLNGKAIPSPNPKGERIQDDSFCVLFNAHYEPVVFTLPEKYGRRWEKVLETEKSEKNGDIFQAGQEVPVAERSILLLRQQAD